VDFFDFETNDVVDDLPVRTMTLTAEIHIRYHPQDGCTNLRAQLGQPKA